MPTTTPLKLSLILINYEVFFAEIYQHFAAFVKNNRLGCIKRWSRNEKSMLLQCALLHKILSEEQFSKLTDLTGFLVHFFPYILCEKEKQRRGKLLDLCTRFAEMYFSSDTANGFNNILEWEPIVSNYFELDDTIEYNSNEDEEEENIWDMETDVED